LASENLWTVAKLPRGVDIGENDKTDDYRSILTPSPLSCHFPSNSSGQVRVLNGSNVCGAFCVVNCSVGGRKSVDGVGVGVVLMDFWWDESGRNAILGPVIRKDSVQLPRVNGALLLRVHRIVINVNDIIQPC